MSLSINPANNRINSSGYPYDANGKLTALAHSTFVSAESVRESLEHMSSMGTLDEIRCLIISRRRWR